MNKRIAKKIRKRFAQRYSTERDFFERVRGDIEAGVARLAAFPSFVAEGDPPRIVAVNAMRQRIISAPDISAEDAMLSELGGICR